MFYNSKDRAYSLLAAYRFTRPGKNTSCTDGRSFSALAFRVRGRSRFSFEGRRCVAEEKSILYIPSGVGYSRVGEDEEIIVLHLSCHGEDDAEITALEAQDAEELFEKLLLAWCEDGKENYNRCMSLLYRILETAEKSAPAAHHNVPMSIAKGVQYISAHYRDPDATVSAAAMLCHVSEVWFRRVYHECFGISPWQDILNRRFSHARTLLQTGYYSVKEVALRSGFSDVKYFRTAFSKRYGCTPSTYAIQAKSI
ncbi:MAG: helix-turn-helix domain-containing protein [Ruminococcaceae bacterium]|nr:helix-turn-helix domain-containing protein [Oscillospiraceae bacterium]